MAAATDPPGPGVLLRPYDPAADFERVFPIVREIVSGPPYEDARRELVQYPGKELVARVAVAGSGQPVGFCAATFPYWNAVAVVDYLVVAPEWRRRGIGADLAGAVESALRAARLRRVCVQTAAWNADGVRFYERMGYRRRAGLPGYFGDDEALTMVWLDKAL